MAQRLKEAIAGFMQKLEEKKKDPPQDDPASFLKKAFTKKELEHIKSSYFKDGVLRIGVDSSSWLYALSLKKEEKLDKLRGKFKVIIKEIRFSLGE